MTGATLIQVQAHEALPPDEPMVSGDPSYHEVTEDIERIRKRR